MTSITVLGLGAMGLPMAQNLSRSFEVRGYDISQEWLKLAEAAGLATAKSARDAVRGSDVVVLAVRDRAQLEAVLTGEDGILHVMEPGTALVLDRRGRPHRVGRSTAFRSENLPCRCSSVWRSSTRRKWRPSSCCWRSSRGMGCG